MIEYFADENIAIGFWEEMARVHYKGYYVDFTYKFSTDFGDIIYEINLKETKEKIYTYGRNLIFFGTSYVFIERVEEGQIGPISTSILDLNKKKILVLDKWYDKIDIDKNISLEASYDGKAKLILDNIENMDWNS